MGEVTAISWCDHTHNHWIGCMKCGPACDGCYAEALMDTRYGRVEWGAPGKGPGTRVLTSEANRRKPLTWNKKALAAGTRPFVFCSSLADVFDNQVPAEWRADLFGLIRATPALVWLLLTKRPQNIVKMSEAAGGLPRNAALGATMASQEEYDRDRIKLAEAKGTLKALFTFGSFEPLLGPVILDRHAADWIITGGETNQGGHKARPSSLGWFRRLRDGARELGRPFHHKQNGEYVSGAPTNPGWFYYDSGDWSPNYDHLWEDGYAALRVGKHRSGRLLDGVEHNARPAVPPLSPTEEG
jgi:protein gp37